MPLNRPWPACEGYPVNSMPFVPWDSPLPLLLLLLLLSHQTYKMNPKIAQNTGTVTPTAILALVASFRPGESCGDDDICVDECSVCVEDGFEVFSGCNVADVGLWTEPADQNQRLITASTPMETIVTTKAVAKNSLVLRTVDMVLDELELALGLEA